MMRRMGRHAQELNDNIRAVLVAAQLEHGLSAAETARGAGRRAEGLPPPGERNDLSRPGAGGTQQRGKTEPPNEPADNAPGSRPSGSAS
jgi:hypothetical protein